MEEVPLFQNAPNCLAKHSSKFRRLDRNSGQSLPRLKLRTEAVFPETRNTLTTYPWRYFCMPVTMSGFIKLISTSQPRRLRYIIDIGLVADPPDHPNDTRKEISWLRLALYCYITSRNRARHLVWMNGGRRDGPHACHSGIKNFMQLI